ncbi:hypothetical protein LCGC14_1493690, partial [marine sediment metagenome]
TLSFVICPITSVKSQDNYDSHYIKYKSNFFSLFFNNETYYGNEDYSLYLEIEMLNKNSIENFSIELSLVEHKQNRVAISMKHKYTYNEFERTLYKNNTKIGIIPIFIENNYQNGQEVLLAEFNNESVTGTFTHRSGRFWLSDKSYSHNSVIVDSATYLEYVYSDVYPMLILWDWSSNYDLTLHKLFNITSIYGDLRLYETNFDLKPQTIIEPILPSIIIILIGVIAFISIFIVIRRKFKIENQKKRKYTKHRHKKY